MACILVARQGVETSTQSLSLVQFGVPSKILFSRGPVVIYDLQLQEKPKVFDFGEELFLVFGTPDFFTDSEEISRTIGVFRGGRYGPLEKLDSCFLIIRVGLDVGAPVDIISDRFNSRPAFFYQSEDLSVVSLGLSSCVEAVRAFRKLEPNWESIFEFLWFRRVFGTKTHAMCVNMVSPASVCRLGHREAKETRYWTPKKQVALPSFSSRVRQLEDTLREGITRSLQGESRKTNILMLSGGLDSRLMLAVGKKSYVAVTNAPLKNNEVRIAERLSSSVGIPHIFLPRPESYVGDNLSQAARCSDGMTVLHECQFLGYQDKLREIGHSVSLGLFYDIFFCGHYLPKYQPTFAGTNVLFFRGYPLPATDLAKFFATNVSYRQKISPLQDVVHEDVYAMYFRKMLLTLEEIESFGRDAGYEKEALWEMFHLTNLGRHYSMLMAKSLRSSLEIHLPALTNDNLQLALNTPISDKTNWKLYLHALRNLCADTEVMNIVNSNTNIAAKHGLWTQSAIKIGRGVGKRLKLYSGIVSPSFSDRSWPPVRQMFDSNANLRHEMERVIEEGKLTQSGFLKKPELRELFERTINRKEDHAIFLSQVLTAELGALAYLD